MKALINRTRPFSFIDSDCLRSSIYLYIQSPVFIYLHFLCLPTFLYLFTFSHSYSYLFITPPPPLFTCEKVKLTFDLRGATIRFFRAAKQCSAQGSRFRNVVVESISSRERGKSGCGSVLIGEESHGFVFEEKRATHWKERSLVTTVSHFSLYFAAKANEEEQRDRAQGVQSTRRAESQDIPSGNFSSEFSFDRAIFFIFFS